MAKEILDIYVEIGYPYEYLLDFNLFDGTDLENNYTCWFYNKHIDSKQFSVVDNAYSLTLTKEDTGKLVDNLEEYVVYVVNNSTNEESKLITGRIVIDKKTRS